MTTITTESHGYGGTGIYTVRVKNVLLKRYKIKQIAEHKHIKNIHISVWRFELKQIQVYLDGKYYDFKKLEWLKNRLPKKQVKKTFWQKLKEILQNDK